MIRKLLASTMLVALLASCTHGSDDPNSYENTFKKSGDLAMQRADAKWAYLEEAGWCIPRTSFFPRPTPGCRPFPPGGVNEAMRIEYQRPSAIRTAMSAANTKPHFMNPSLIDQKFPHIPGTPFRFGGRLLGGLR